MLDVVVSRPGQSACLNGKLVSICLAQINDPDPLLRRWIALCMAKLWEGFDDAKWTALRDGAHKRLCSLLTDPAPEVIPVSPSPSGDRLVTVVLYQGSRSGGLRAGHVHGRGRGL
jgi:hypothetical protein